MGVIFDEPKYPVIDKAPGFLKTGKCEEESIMLVSARSSLSDLESEIVLHAVRNFSMSDYTTFAGTTALCAPFGYLVGKLLLCVQGA